MEHDKSNTARKKLHGKFSKHFESDAVISTVLLWCVGTGQTGNARPTFALGRSQHQQFHGWREITGCWCCSGQLWCPHSQRKTSLLLTSNTLSICFSFTPVLKLITALIFRNHFAFKPKNPILIKATLAQVLPQEKPIMHRNWNQEGQRDIPLLSGWI